MQPSDQDNSGVAESTIQAIQPTNQDGSTAEVVESTMQAAQITGRIPWKRTDLLIIFLISFIFTIAGLILPDPPLPGLSQIPGGPSLIGMLLLGAGAIIGTIHWLGQRRLQQLPTPMNAEELITPTSTGIPWRWRGLLLIFFMIVSFIFVFSTSDYISELSFPDPLSFTIISLMTAGATITSIYWLGRWSLRQSKPSTQKENETQPASPGINWKWADPLLIIFVSIISFITSAILIRLLHLTEQLSEMSLWLVTAGVTVAIVYWLKRLRRSSAQLGFDAQPTPASITWKWSDLFIIIIVGLILEGVSDILPDTLISNRALYTMISTFLSAGAIVSTVYWLGLRPRREGWTSIGIVSPSWRWPWGLWRWLWLALLLEIPLTMAVGYIQLWLGLANVNAQHDLLFPSGPSWVSIVGSILGIGIAVPFAEELFFRGVVYRLLRPRWGVAVAVIVSAAFFGVAHGDLIVGLSAGIGGLVYALVYERTKSLWPSIIMHATGNIIVELFVINTLFAAHTRIPLF